MRKQPYVHLERSLIKEVSDVLDRIIFVGARLAVALGLVCIAGTTVKLLHIVLGT